MKSHEFNEIKGIALEMKANGKSKVLEATPIAIVVPSEGVTVERSTSKTPIVPHSTVAQVQPAIVQPLKKTNEDEVQIIEDKTSTPLTKRKSK